MNSTNQQSISIPVDMARRMSIQRDISPSSDRLKAIAAFNEKRSTVMSVSSGIKLDAKTIRDSVVLQQLQVCREIQDLGFKFNDSIITEAADKFFDNVAGIVNQEDPQQMRIVGEIAGPNFSFDTVKAQAPGQKN